MESLRKIAKQTSAQVLGKAISSIATFLTLVLITRFYGAEGTGVYTLALTYLAFFYLFADLGLNGYALQRLDDHKDEANRLFNFRLVWSALLLLISIAIPTFLPFYSLDFFQSVLIGSSSIICFGIFNSTNLIFQKNLKYELSVLSSSIGALTSVILTVVILKTLSLPVPFLILGPTIGFLVNVMVAEVLVHKYYQFTIKLKDLSYPFEVFKQAWPVSATLLINTVYFRIDTFILASLKPMAEVGFYNLAYQIFQAVLVIPTFIMNAFYPRMLETYNQRRPEFKRLVFVCSLLFLTSGLLVTILVWNLADLIIGLISGGNGFSLSAKSLKVLSTSFPAFFLSALYIWVLMTIKAFKWMLSIYLAGFLFNLAANLYLIPGYSLIGASITTVLSEYLILSLQIGILIWLLKRGKTR